MRVKYTCIYNLNYFCYTTIKTTFVNFKTGLFIIGSNGKY